MEENMPTKAMARALETEGDSFFFGCRSVIKECADRGWLREAGRLPWAQEPYYSITDAGREALKRYQKKGGA